MNTTKAEVAEPGSHVVVAEAGDDVMTVLSAFADDQRIGPAQISAVGTFQRATIGWFDRDRQDYHRIEIDQPSEVLELTGEITAGADGPLVRAQVIVGLPDGTTRGGHLLSATAWPTVEATVVETRSPSVAPAARSSASIILAGIALILLGAWGALSPFIGPYFDFGLAPNATWQWTSARGWLEVVPGCVAALGGLIMIISANRFVVILGGLLAAAAGGWFIVGTSLADLLRIGSLDSALGSRPGIQALEWLALFYALGGVILLVVAFVLGRLSATSSRRAQRTPEPAASRARVQPATQDGRDRWEGSLVSTA